MDLCNYLVFLTWLGIIVFPCTNCFEPSDQEDEIFNEVEEYPQIKTDHVYIL